MASVLTRKKPIDKENDAMDCPTNVMDYPATQAFTCSDDEETESSDSEEKTVIQIGKIIVGSVSYPIYRGITKVGRLSSCGVVINDGTVSKEHAEIEADTGSKSTFICDLGSMNKTRLNNILLRPRKMYQLNYGDTIRFGSVITKYSKIAENTAGDSDPSKQSYQKRDDFVVPETPARLSRDAAATICIPSSPDISFTSDRSSIGNCSDVSLVMGTQQPVPCSRQSNVVSVEKNSNARTNLSLGNISSINGSCNPSILDAEIQKIQPNDEDDIFDNETQRSSIFDEETEKLTIQDNDSKHANSHKEDLHQNNVPESPTQQTSIYDAETQQIAIDEEHVDRRYVDGQIMDPANIYEQATQITNIHEAETQPINITTDDVIIRQTIRSPVSENRLESAENSLVSSPVVARIGSMPIDSRNNNSPTNSAANHDQTSKLESGTKDEDSETDEEGLFDENHSPKNSDDELLQKSADEMYDAPTQLIRASSKQRACAEKNLKANEIAPSDANASSDGSEKVVNGATARQKSSQAFDKQNSSSLVDEKASKRTIIDESLDEDETDFEDEADSLLSVAEAITTREITSNNEIVKPKKIALKDDGTKSPCASSDSGTEDATATMKPNDSIEDKLNDLFEEAKNDSFVEEPTQLLTQTLHKVLETTQVVEEDGSASPTHSKISVKLDRENTVSSPRLTPTNVATTKSDGLEEKDENTTSAKNLDCASNNNIESSPQKNKFAQVKPLMSSTLVDTEDLFADLPEVTLLSTAKKRFSPEPHKKRGKSKDKTTTLAIVRDSDSDLENDEAVVEPTTSKRKTVRNKKNTTKPIPVATSKTVPQETSSVKDQGAKTVQKRFSSRISKAKTTSDQPTASSTVPTVPPVAIPADDVQLENIPEPHVSSKKKRKTNVRVEKNQALIMPLLKMMKVKVSAEKMSAVDVLSKKNRATTVSDEQDSTVTVPTKRSASENVPPEKMAAESVSGEKIPVAKTRAKKKQSANISSDNTPDTNTTVKRVSTRPKRQITSYATLNKDQILVENQTAQMSTEQVSPALAVVQRIDNVSSTSETSNKPPNTDSKAKVTAKNRSAVSVAKPGKDSVAVADVEVKTAVPETINGPGSHVTVRTTRRKIDKVTVRRGPTSPMVRINYDKPASPVPVPPTPETPQSGTTLTIDEPNSSEQKPVRRRRTVGSSGTDTVNEVVAKRKKVNESAEALVTPKTSKHEETKSIKTSHASCSSPVAIISLRKVEGSSSLWTTNTKPAKSKTGKKQELQTLKNSTTEKSDTLSARNKPQSRSLRSSLVSTTVLQQLDGRPSLESQEIETILTNSINGSDRITAVDTGNRIPSRRIPCQRLDNNRDDTDEDEQDDDDVFESNSRSTNQTKTNTESEKPPSKRRKVTRGTPNVIEPTTVGLMSSKTPKENDNVVAAKMTKVTQRVSSSAKSVTSEKAAKHRVLFTGVSDEGLISAVRDLGGFVTEKPNECTVLVTDKVRRTFKFLCAMARAVPIVSADWLFDSQKQKQFLPVEQYSLDDPVEEKKYKFNLRKSLDSAKRRRLLEGWTVVLAPNTAPPPRAEMKGIIQACGGNPVIRAPATWPAKVVVVAKEEDPSSWNKITKTAPVRVPLVSREFILTGILRQELNFEEHRLHVR